MVDGLSATGLPKAARPTTGLAVPVDIAAARGAARSALGLLLHPPPKVEAMMPKGLLPDKAKPLLLPVLLLLCGARLIAGLTDGLAVRAGAGDMGVMPLSGTCATGGGTKVGAPACCLILASWLRKACSSCFRPATAKKHREQSTKLVGKYDFCKMNLGWQVCKLLSK